MPLLIQARPALAQAYCQDDGRPAVDPALLLGVTARKERIDSTQVLGLVSRMSRLECCRETLALALKELARLLAQSARPAWWPTLWERYVESRIDFRAEPKVLAEKFQQAGQDGLQVLSWLKELQLPLAPGSQPTGASHPAGADGRPTSLPALSLQPKAIPPAGAVHNPHEPEAQWAAKGVGRPLIGPAQPAPRVGGRFTTEDFTVDIAQRQARCPAGHLSSQCSRLEVQATGKVNFRFEWSYHCADCPLRRQCCGVDQKHRTVVVGQ